MTLRPDAMFHPLYLSPRRGLDVDPFEPLPKKRADTLDAPRRPVRDRAFHVEHVRLEIDVDVEKGAIAGTATLTVRPVASGLTMLTLDAAEMKLGAVTLARAGGGRAGRRLRTAYDGAKLVIKLDRAYGHEETATVRIAYRAKPRRGFWFVRPDAAYPHRHAQGWSQGQAEDSRAWFPIHDHPNDKFTSEIIVTAASDLRTVANGRLLAKKRSPDGTTTTWHWTQERPHPAYLVSLVVAPYVETKAKAGTVPLRFYAFAGQGRAAKRLFGKTADMVKTFERLFGAYPWREYAQTLVSEFTWGGMENTGTTTLTEKALLDDRAALDLTYEGLVSHELAHQWFGDLVTCRGWHHNWLNEAWATFCENLYEEKAHGPEAAQWERVQKRAQYLAQDLAQYRRPIVFDRYVIPMDLFDRHAYEKGSLVLTMLRDELGDEVFFRAARRHLATHAFGFADTHDFRRAFEEESARDLGWFFDQWVFAAGYPELEVAWRAERRNGRATGRALVTIRQAQSTREAGHETTPLFRFGVDVIVWSGGAGRSRGRHHRLMVTKREETFAIDGAGGAPARIAVDPDFRLLCTLDLAQDAAAWRHALVHDPSPAERMRAARTLAALRGAALDRATTAALERALTHDAAAPVRMAAAIALGERAAGRRGPLQARTVRTLAATLAGSREPAARRAAAFALGLCGRAGEAALLAACAPGRTGDRSYMVQATALKALANMRSPKLLAACSAAMESRGWRDLIPMAALDALAMAPVPAAFDLAYAHVRYGETQEVREAAVRLLVALAKDKKVRLARREQARHVAPTLAELMADPSVFVQLAAAQGAGKLGDKSLVTALRGVQRDAAWDYLVRTAGKSIKALHRKAKA